MWASIAVSSFGEMLCCISGGATHRGPSQPAWRITAPALNPVTGHSSKSDQADRESSSGNHNTVTGWRGSFPLGVHWPGISLAKYTEAVWIRKERKRQLTKISKDKLERERKERRRERERALFTSLYPTFLQAISPPVFPGPGGNNPLLIHAWVRSKRVVVVGVETGDTLSQVDGLFAFPEQELS